MTGAVLLGPYHGFAYHNRAAQIIFKFLREHILAVGSYNYILFTSCNIDEIIIVYISQIARMEPAVLYNFCCFLRHIVIAHHYVGTFKTNLPDAFIVLVFDLHLHARKEMPYR